MMHLIEEVKDLVIPESQGWINHRQMRAMMTRTMPPKCVVWCWRDVLPCVVDPGEVRCLRFGWWRQTVASVCLTLVDA